MTTFIGILDNCNEWTDKEEEKNSKDIIAYDGKICRGSKHDNTKDGRIQPINVMTEFNVIKDIPLATRFINEKTNEHISFAKSLLYQFYRGLRQIKVIGRSKNIDNYGLRCIF